MVTLSDLLAEPVAFAEFHRSVVARVREARTAAMARTAGQIGLHFPEAADIARKEAEMALRGEWIYPGTQGKPFPIGHPPAWHENPVGDDEFVWGLNRMPHWVPMLRAYSLTGEDRYARQVCEQLSDWIDRCPRPPLAGGAPAFSSVDPWRALEAGIRMFDSWPCVLEHLADSGKLTPELLEKFAVSCYEHGEVLAEVCPRIWPEAESNHYLMENLGLLQVAVAFPEFRVSERWREQAVRELERCARRQLTEDGGQIEGCPHYHNGCVYWLCLAVLILRRAGGSFSVAYMDRLRRSLDYTLHATRPTGEGVPWGDSDADHYNVKSALFGYLAFGEIGWLKAVEKLAGRRTVLEHAAMCAWFLDDIPRFLRDLEHGAPIELPRVNWQRELKQVSLRTDWSRNAIGVFFACRTPVHNTHAHIDPMGFDLTLGGRPALVDPGRFTYRDDEDRRTYKSAEWHNTLTVNGRSPFEYRGSWAFGPQKEGGIVRVDERPGLLVAEAVHQNYEPAVHRRLIAIVRDAFVLVLDRVDGLASGDEVQIYYHFRSGNAVWNAGSSSAFAAGDGDGSGFSLFAGGKVDGRLLEGSVSEVLDVAFPSKRLLLADSGGVAGSRANVAVIVPHSGQMEAPDCSGVRIACELDGNVRGGFSLDGEHFVFEWGEQGLGIRT